MGISLPRDNNRITVIGGTSSTDGTSPVTIYVDPTTHRMKVDASSTANLIIGTSTITSGTTGRILYDNGGVVGELNTATYPSLTELSYVKGVTSAIQTQINAKVGTDANGNISIPNNVGRTAITATSGGTTTLDVASKYQQIFTGTQGQTIILPVAATLTAGQEWVVDNNSTQALTINTSGGNTLLSVAPKGFAIITCTNTAGGTGTASWDYDYGTSVFASGKILTVNNTLTLSGTDGSTLAVGTGGTLGTAAYTASTAYAPSGRNITINGTTQDLSADRTWTVSGGGFTYDGTVVVNGTTPTVNTWTALDMSAIVGSARKLCFLKITSAANPNYDDWVVNTRTYNDTAIGNLWGVPATGTIATGTRTPIGANTAVLNGRNNANGAYVTVITDTAGKIEWGSDYAGAITITLLGYL